MSLGWLSIGATNDITLTGLNVDNGTLYVDKVNNRVGIGSTVLSNILQVGAPSVGISTYNPLSSSGIAMFSNKYASPDTAGVNDFGATLWINSSYGYLQNAGASIGLGAVSSSTVDSTHTTYARISGVQAMDTDDRKGDFVIETTNVDKMYERIRVKAEGNVGIGLDDPVGRLHVNGNIISELGITNNGYRREKPVTFAFANSSTERVTNDTTLTMLAPAGTGRGWLARIDDGSELDPQSEYVNGVISSASDGVIFAVGTFTGVVSVYQEGGVVVETTFDTSERAYPQNRSGFVAKYNDEGSIEGFAVVEYPDTVELTSVSLSGNSQPDVIVTGYLTKLDASNLIIYNSGSPISGTGSQEPVPGVANGGKVGFVIIYDFNLTFRRLVYIHTNEGLIGEVMPTNAVCYTNDPENVLYISGQFKASSGVINASTTNFPGVTEQGTVTTTPIRTNSYDVFLCRYNIDRVNKYLAPVWMTAVQNSTGTTNDNVEHPSRALSVDESVGATGGDVYMCGYSRSDTIRFYNNADVEQTSFALTRGVSTQVGFMARYDKTGAIKWSAKIAGSNLGEEATIRSLTFHTDSKRLIVTGSFKGNSVTFFNSNSTTPVVSQEGLEDKFSAFVASYDCSPTSACNVAWTTKIQPKQQNVYGMIIDNDVNGNIYTSFHLVAASTTYDNVTTDVYTAFGLNPTSASYHSVSGVADYIGIVCYNPNGKVLFTGKIDGSGTENIRAMDVYGPNADDPSRLIVGMVSGGNSFNCYDMTGISFEFATNLFNTPTTNTTSAFVIQYPSFTFYLMDTPPVELGTVKKFINTTSNRAYVIPYYDLDGSLDTSFTNAIYAVPGGSSIELTHGAPESWYASKDTDASSVYVDKINGGVGIGTTDPQRLLHVEGEALIKGNLYIDGLIINPYITFGLSGAIGIGTTNPVGFLHIYKPDPRIILQNSVGNSEQTSGTLELIQKDNTGARLTYDGREGVDSFFLKMTVGNVEQTPAALTVSNRTSVSTGFVGIGITQPTARLHVKDSFKIEVGSRAEEGSDYGLQQVRDWGYSNDQFEYNSTWGTLRSCVYAPTIGELGRWVACGYRYIVYSDDGGDTWTTANDTWSSTPVANRRGVYYAGNGPKDVNPYTFSGLFEFENFAEYVWTNVNWIEAAPVAPSEEELPTLISDTTLSDDYSGFVKVSGDMTLTLPKPSTSQVGREITIMKMDTDFFTTVRVTTVSGTNINGSESVWLGRSHNEDGTSNVNVSLGTVGTSSRYNLRVVWTGEFWNVTGPNNHPRFPDGVFIAVNRDGEGGDAKRLAYSYKHETQNWGFNTSKGSGSNSFQSNIVYKYSNSGVITPFTAGTSLDSPALVLGPETGNIALDFMTPRDVKVIGSGTSAKAYICGWYEASSTVTLDTGKTLPATGGVNHAYIIKLSASGAVDWARSIPSTANSIAFSTAIDSSNNVYVTGQYNSLTTVALDAVTLPSTSGNDRLFVVKLNSSGTFVNTYGHPSANGSAGKSILVRGSSDVFLSGILNSSTMFLGRCTQSLGSFDFSTTITSPTLSNIGDKGPVIAINGSETRIYLAGRYKSNTSISVGSYTLPAKPLGDCQGFLISFQINAPFNGFTSDWGTAVITSSDQYSDIRAITVDGNGDVFVTGSYESNVPVELTFGGAVLPITYKYGAINPEPQSTFVASYNSQGVSQWANTIQNTVSGYGNSIVRDSFNDIYVTGVYRSDPGKKLFIGLNSQSGEKEYLLPNSAENIDVASVFLIKYSNNGNVLWARNHGMDTNETQYPVIGIDGSNNIYWAMDLMGITRTYNANTDKYEAGERWFIINFGNNDYYWRASFVTSAYDSMNNRLVLLTDTIYISTATTYFTMNSGRDNPLAGRFWDPSITPTTNAAWGREDDRIDPTRYDSMPSYVTASFYKQGSRTTNSYIMTSRNASSLHVGNLWFLRSSDQDVFFYRIVWSVAGFFSPFNKNFQDLAYSAEQNKFVMCANSGTRRSVTLTLTNDENFTGSSISVSDFPITQSGEGSDLYDWRGIAWAPELGYYVIACHNHTPGNSIYASKDGATWIAINTSFTGHGGNNQIDFLGVAWGSKTGFVAVGDNTDAKIAIARSFRYPTPPNSLVDTKTALDINGNTVGNLVLGNAPLYTPFGDSPLYMVRAWVVFSGPTSGAIAVIRKEGNVSSVTRKATGIYEIRFRKALSTVNYAVFVTSTRSGGELRTSAEREQFGTIPSRTSFRITTVTWDGDSGRDTTHISVMVIY